MTMPDEDVTPDADLAPDERDLETPDADALEQATPADPLDDPGAAQTPTQVHRGLDVEREVNEYDAVEQARVVPLDEDER